jgi:hypothetical protein
VNQYYQEAILSFTCNEKTPELGIIPFYEKSALPF